MIMFSRQVKRLYSNRFCRGYRCNFFLEWQKRFSTKQARVKALNKCISVAHRDRTYRLQKLREFEDTYVGGEITQADEKKGLAVRSLYFVTGLTGDSGNLNYP